ncbi:MAG: LysM peptidoglycan-binding domain-containing protein, partial [Undibacterium sp.]|nr:LysM peptidoglycan-binding domain-containing protein [Undibacterium sp.]
MIKKHISNWTVIFLVLSSALLAACGSTPNKAPVVERSDVPVEVSKPTEVPTTKPPGEPRPTYTVKKGDSLKRIAIDLGISYNDLLAWNNIANPNDIKVDQVLWIGAPDGSAKTSAVSSSSGAEIRNLNPINSATNKTSPRGDKRPYSEANLAELQKAEANNNAVVVSKTETPAPAKPNEKVAVVPAPEAIAWIWPTNGKVLSDFEQQKKIGIDLGGKEGQPVFAAAAGTVSYEGKAIRGLGNLLIINHANNYLTAYSHN